MSTIAGLKRPEFTGSNRCWPCTALNVALLALVVGVLAPLRPIPAAAAAVVGTAVIWLRGYLVPYTPRFAPKLAARLQGDVFDHSTRAESLEDVREGATDGEAVLEALVEAGVVTVDGDRLGLRESVADAWRTRMSALADSPDALVEAAQQDVAGIDAARVEALDDETYLVVAGESTAWLPQTVAVAEVGAVQALAETDLPAARREVAAHAVCAFLDTCPVCGDHVVEGQADDCCGHTVPDPSYEPPTVLACENCGVAFYTLEQPADAAE